MLQEAAIDDYQSEFEKSLNAGDVDNEFGFNRRRDSRQKVLYYVALLNSGSDRGLARVIDISDSGMQLATKLDLSLGGVVAVDLSESCTLTGTVVWVKGAHCGVKLLTAIDSTGLMDRLRREMRSPGTRPLRVSVDKKIVCRSELGKQIVRLRDISQRGAKIVHDGSLSEGLPVTLQIALTTSCRGVVRWSRDGLAGVQFEKELSVPDLGSMRDL